MGSVVQRALAMVVPPVLLPLFEHSMAEASLSIPHKATMSRWKFLLAGALMRAQGRQSAEQEFHRSIVADYSTQHGRAFQLIAM